MPNDKEVAARREQGTQRNKRLTRKRVDDLLRAYFEALKARAVHDKEGFIGWLQRVFRPTS